MNKSFRFRNNLLAVIILLCFISLTSYSIFTGNGFYGLGRDKSEEPHSSTVISVIPKPISCRETDGVFRLSPATEIIVNGRDTDETKALYVIAEYLIELLRPSTGYCLSIMKDIEPSAGSILLTTENPPTALGIEGYQLDITTDKVSLQASAPQGIFYGIQTLRQMLPPEIELTSLHTDTDWTIPCSSIQDYPAYEWRGMMLDVSRHFIQVQDVKKTIDHMAEFKLNTLHLHLSDDQGWRIEIKSWPDLVKIGGSSEVGGGAGGYYTQEEYVEIVEYAQDRFITIVPEIEMPGHSNAALASYGELNPDGNRKALYTGIEVGFSSFQCRSEATYQFLDDVIRELAALTPGEYIHIGGDEASSTSKEDYDYLITRVKEIVSSYGKKAIGWNPYETATGISSEDLLQNWSADADHAIRKNMKIIMSPPAKTYLDMKYYKNSPLGLEWAGYTNTEDAYEWDPTDYTPAGSVIGVEGALWSETIKNMEDIEYLAFPRLPGLAEIGWTPVGERNWKEYRIRLAQLGIRMDYQEINYYKDPDVPWSN